MLEEIEASLERIVYEAEEDGYMVARLSLSDTKDALITAVGKLAAAIPGESLILKGRWKTHPKYGRQFEVKKCSSKLPATESGIRKYLSSGLIKGIGPVIAGRIIDHFGKEAFTIIERSSQKLGEVEGIGEKRLTKIKKAWEEQKDIREVMVFLKNHDVSTTYGVKIYQEYGKQALDILRKNPYRLAQDIYGVGFKTADRIAKKIGIEPNALERIKAGVEYALSQAVSDGHVFLPNHELINRGAELLETEPDRIRQAISELAQQERLVLEKTKLGDSRILACYLAPFYYGEKGVVSRLAKIIATKRKVGSEKINNLLHQLKRRKAINYNQKQKLAIRKSLQSKVLILTGGPGTGKTTTVKGILQVMEWLSWKVLLAAPTGRAAKRLSETTGREAKTIHRLLGYQPPNRFEHHQDNPLKADAVILDELSMVDLILMNNLLKAISPHTRLILVGDVDQLPSVGAGNVLGDLIKSGEIEVIKLTQIFRQAKRSKIVVNAHRINQGKFPWIKTSSQDDFFFIKKEDPKKVAKLVSDLVSTRLPSHYGYNPIDDIQVLTPMYRGETGVDNLNRLLQDRLNPKDAFNLPFTSRQFRLGDKVMQIRNNSEKEVFNGDIGRIVGVDKINQLVKVKFPDQGIINYELSDLDELVLAYAITIHKSQGNEYKVVVMPILTQHYVMLQRNLLYTAVTRAEELAVIVGTTKALGIAVNNDKEQLRYSLLSQRLREQADRIPTK